MASRCSIVPCSRSRITAAPARMIASMVMLLMIAIDAHEPARWSMLGLKALADNLQRDLRTSAAERASR